jgi:hypothetical protein
MLSCDCSDADGADDSGSDSDEVSEDPASQWDVCHDDAGNAFFVNRITNESVWDKPDGFRCVCMSVSCRELCHHLIVCVLDWCHRVYEESVDPGSGLTYYYNRVTRESVWERPIDYVKVPAKCLCAFWFCMSILVFCLSHADERSLGGTSE